MGQTAAEEIILYTIYICELLDHNAKIKMRFVYGCI